MSTIDRIIIEVLLAAVLLGFAVIYLEHRGEIKIEQADIKAEEALNAKIAAESVLALNKAQAADLQASHDQQILNAYRAAHPSQSIRVCNSNGSSSRLPKAGPAAGTAAGSRATAVAVQSVPTGSTSPDIGPAVATIVQSCERLGILYAEFQNR